MDTSQRRELNRGLGDGFTRSFELALAPVVLGLLGLWLDRTFGTFPVLMIVLGVLAAVGAFVRAWYAYVHDMQQHEEVGSWAKRS